MAPKSQSSLSADQPSRLFNPIPTSNEAKHLSDITLYDQETGLTNILRRLPGSRFSEVMESELLISVDGVLSKHEVQTEQGNEQARGAWAVFFGEDSKYNKYGLLKKDMATTGQQAELYAVKAALEGFCKWVWPISPKIQTVVLMTHSEVLEKGFHKNVWGWEGNGWKTCRGTPVVDAEVWKELHELIKGCEKRGLVVEFLRVKRSWNVGAVVLATMALHLGEEENEKEELGTDASTMVAPKEWSPAITYFLDVAPATPEVQSLCLRLDITMATRETFERINNVLQRLIIAGEDTPKNFKLLFGSEWETGIKRVWAKERIEVLARPPESMAAEWWSPRAPSEEEEKKLDMENLEMFMAWFQLKFK